ncbi:glutamine-hydrolyzing carbamoyl-phosphate synthase small subunit [Heliorestis acidaminivorans]|uniref:Carbamoyl phosphate synthase small chain n=2 Tax=Heliorestis acidaminivorans TaxID=553427 RepID=A0A6I0F054_9FIRM|nr:glutamine-hydrolyzing carbamoyl-phosphate synthase small subunit [Heliorestis acidaminivorans]
MQKNHKNAYLLLEDGTIFKGRSFGYQGDMVGEVVFNTAMIGYQEILTDPSYCGQIVTMTYPLIGNYGVNAKDAESVKPQVRGFVVREACARPSHYRSEKTIEHYLAQHGIPGIEGVDTRALTRRIRIAGTLRGAILVGSKQEPCWEGEAIATKPLGALMTLEEMKASLPVESYQKWQEQLAKLQQHQVAGPHLIETVTTPQSYVIPGESFRVAVIDLGIKENILRMLKALDLHLTVFPAHTTAEEIRAAKPQGIFLSNGPGNPKDAKATVQAIQEFLKPESAIPVFGICLGHQLISLAFGGDTYKMKFGHRGGNHPVQDLRTGRVYITSQNHGYTIIEDSLPADVAISHRNANDGTVEGLRHRTLPVYSVQFHPEAAPGPEDTAYLFDEFIEHMQTGTK